MKPFDLEKALMKKPVLLRNGNKAFVLADLNDLEMPCKIKDSYRLSGVYFSEREKDYFNTSWDIEGKYVGYSKSHGLDIIGMWQEPRELVTITFPKPLTHDEAEKLDEFWCLKIPHDLGQNRPLYFSWKHASKLHIDAGLFFATREDAETFVNALNQVRG